MPRSITTHEAQTIRGCMALLPAAVRDITHSQAVYRIGGQGSHIHWNTGHLVWSLDDMGAFLGLPAALPAIYEELYATGSEPKPDAASYPALAEVLDQSAIITDRVAAFIGALDDTALSTPIPPGHPLAVYYPDWRELIASSGFHIGYHLGQIGLLRRAQGLASVF